VSDLEKIGGSPALEAIMDDFVDRCFDDVMIGFFFRKASRDRIKRLERELAAAHLGGAEPYTGRPIHEAHSRHPILGGHFARRIQILRDTLADHGVPEEIRARWIAHDERQRPLVTAQPDSNCNDLAGREREER
jgi:hemoglobin